MAITRRRFFALVAGILASVLGGAWIARAQEQARAIHHATRNTLRGAVGVWLRRLVGQRPARAKPWVGYERAALPEPVTTPARALADALGRHAPAPGFAPRPIEGGILARLLQAAYGVTGTSPDGVALRAAPSAGALYAGEVYVVAERIEGLAPGVYAFAPLEQRLVVVRRGAVLGEAAGALEEPARAEGAAVAVLLTNVFARYRFRYANRGYRYALIDSGHIGENLRLAATSAGLAEWGPLRFHDDRLNELLGIDGVREAVCAIHFVGARGEPPAADAEARPRLVERAALRRQSPETGDDEVTRYHVATKLVPGDSAQPIPSPAAARDAAASDTEEETTQERVALPTPRLSGVRVEAAIAARRSAERFRREPIAARDLAFVLDAACGHPALVRAPGVALRLFVHRVDGVPPGLHHLGGDTRALVPLRSGELADALVEACLGQEMAGTAAVGIAMVAALEAKATRGGDRAYRDLCLECGGVGQRIYLAAEAVGLAARNLAAFVDAQLNELADVDGRRRAVIHLTMLGRRG